MSTSKQLRGSWRSAADERQCPYLHPALRQSLFMAGTDTGVGKTRVAVRLLRRSQLTACAASRHEAGSGRRGDDFAGWRNDDALDLRAAANVQLAYEWLNPYLPARQRRRIWRPGDGRSSYRAGPSCRHLPAIKSRSDVIIVEGAGGWLALDRPRRNWARSSPTMQDVALALGLPVVLVVGLRLGCLNHALLTAARHRTHPACHSPAGSPIPSIRVSGGRRSATSITLVLGRLACTLLLSDEAPRVYTAGSVKAPVSAGTFTHGEQASSRAIDVSQIPEIGCRCGAPRRARRACARRLDWSEHAEGRDHLSGEIYWLHMLILWICVVIGFFVFGWMILSLVKFRKSQGAVPDTKLVHSTKAEILWTVDPGVHPGGHGRAGRQDA